MAKSASSPSAAAARRKRKSGKTITSLDGKKTITIEEFDKLFDDGSDEIDAFIDWEKPVFQHGGRRANSGRKRSGRKPYQIRLRPDVHEKIKNRAGEKGLSISEYVETLVK
jgi:hypothetical protein